LSPLLYWLRYFFTAHPLPFGGMDVSLHPVAWAGWGGLLITSLNLIPAGQLDGGHMMYVLFGQERARRILPVILVALMGMGFIWPGWWLWALIIFFIGRAYAEPLDQITPLDTKRKLLAALGLVVFFLLFTPVPLSLLF
jgi:membrane-associated protease RseP (regulator of RpoE activity)